MSLIPGILYEKRNAAMKQSHKSSALVDNRLISYIRPFLFLTDQKPETRKLPLNYWY